MLDPAEYQVLDRIEADRAEPEGVADPGLHLIGAEGPGSYKCDNGPT